MKWLMLILVWSSSGAMAEPGLMERLGLTSEGFKTIQNAAKKIAAGLREKSLSLGKDTQRFEGCQAYLNLYRDAELIDQLTRDGVVKEKLPEEYAYLRTLSGLSSRVVKRGTGFLNENSLRSYFGLSEQPLPPDFKPLKDYQKYFVPSRYILDKVEKDPLEVAKAIASHELNPDYSPAALLERLQELIDLRTQIHTGLQQNGKVLVDLLIEYYLTLNLVRHGDGHMQDNIASYFSAYMSYMLLRTYTDQELRASQGIFLSGEPPSTSLPIRRSRFFREREHFLKNKKIFEKHLARLDELRAAIEVFDIPNLLIFKTENLASHTQLQQVLQALQRVPKRLQPKQLLDIDDFN